jgi:excisionase family DNA binding protein
MIFPVLSGNAKFAAMKKKKDKPKMLTVNEAADLTGIPASTIRMYAREQRLTNAEAVETPRGKHWLIPETSLDELPKRRPGRPKGAKNKPKYIRRKR